MVGNAETGDSEWPPDGFEEWLTETADAEDVTERELLYRMMASFWVLTEFEDLVGDDTPADFAKLDAALGGPAHAPPTDQRPDEPRGIPGETPAETATDATAAGSAASASHGAVPDTLAAFLSELTTSLGEQTDDAAADDAGTTADEPRDDGARDDLRSDLADVADEQDALADRQDALEAAHDDLARRVDHDFEQVEKVLRHLVEEHRDAEDTLDQVEGTLSALLSDYRTERAAADRLDDLLQAAHEHGVETGVCDHCGDRITLSLLTRPACPHCGVPLDGVRPRGWFRTAVVTTAPHRDRDAANGGDETPRDERPPSPDARPDADPDASPGGADAADAGDQRTDAAEHDDAGDDPGQFEWSSL